MEGPTRRTMDLNTRKEQFSNAFIYAVTAAAGCAVAKPSVDNDSIDWTISNRLPRRPKLDVQLKCTEMEATADSQLSFVLKIKNYDDLRITDLIAPRILVVVLVPVKPEEWIESRPGELLLRRSAYWMSLAGIADSRNEATVTIKIPTSQAFTVKSLSELMNRVNEGAPL